MPQVYFNGDALVYLSVTKRSKATKRKRNLAPLEKLKK